MKRKKYGFTVDITGLPLYNKTIPSERRQTRIVEITLKAARVNKNIKQKDAAKLMGIGLSTLQNYEAGKTFPDVPVIKRIEKLYDVEYKDIIFIP